MDTILICLALTVFQEARGEPVAGQRAVATVVLNRARIRNMSECDVVLEKGQFSWKPSTYINATRKGHKKEYRIARNMLPLQAKGWKSSLDAAQYALGNEDTLLGIEFFHSIHAKPQWNRRFVRVFRIGRHVFYARNTDTVRRNVAKMSTSGRRFTVDKA